MSEGFPNQSTSYKDMFRKLSSLFHPDKGGETRLMQDLNTAYEKAKTGKPKDIEKLYVEWVGPGSGERQERNKLAEELKMLSADYFERKRKNDKTVPFNVAAALKLHYNHLCSERGLTPTENDIHTLLYEEGWIPEEQHQKWLETHK